MESILAFEEAKTSDSLIWKFPPSKNVYQAIQNHCLLNAYSKDQHKIIHYFHNSFRYFPFYCRRTMLSETLLIQRTEYHLFKRIGLLDKGFVYSINILCWMLVMRYPVFIAYYTYILYFIYQIVRRVGSKTKNERKWLCQSFVMSSRLNNQKHF